MIVRRVLTYFVIIHGKSYDREVYNSIVNKHRQLPIPSLSGSRNYAKLETITFEKYHVDGLVRYF